MRVSGERCARNAANSVGVSFQTCAAWVATMWRNKWALIGLPMSRRDNPGTLLLNEFRTNGLPHRLTKRKSPSLVLTQA